ncbi:MAG: galactokinase family protein [Anaerolineales bacterium]|jgi:galactokinase/mevalonate kinase-like predicted kinase
MNFDLQKIVVSAPGRAGIIGNPTDMYGGAVMSCSVDMRAHVEITSAQELLLETNGQVFKISGTDDLRPRGDYFDIARAVLDYLHAVHNPTEKEPLLACHVSYGSKIPIRSGMAGSTALVVALLQAFLTWLGEENSLYRLAERARYIELNYLKVVCGYQDAYMCAFGGLNYMDFGGKQFYKEAESELFATIEPLSDYVVTLPFVLAHTGLQHASGAVHKPIRQRWLEGETEVVEGYTRITEIARNGKKALLTEDWPMLGRLMNENHAIQRDLGGSGESNEKLIRTALQAGAPGAKLAGAGHGGTIIALWPWSDSSKLEEALLGAGASKIYQLKIAPGVMVEGR